MAMTGPVFVTGFEHLALNPSPGRGDIVSGVFSITTDRAFIERLIPDECRPAIGSIEAESLTSGRPVAYARVPGLALQSDAEAYQKLVGWLQLVTIFLQHVWFIKDNAAGLELGYVFWPKLGRVTTTRTFLGFVFTEADLASTDRRLSVDEFRQTRDLFQRNVADRASSNRIPTRVSRLDRAQYFVQGARVASHVPVKIANYCTALEALFSNDTSELTHKLSERVGWFIGSSGPDRVDVFQRVKKAYGIRSKVVHGSTDWGKNALVADETSRFLDGLLRTAFRCIRADSALEELFTGDSESIKRTHEEYLLGMVLGNGQLPTG